MPTILDKIVANKQQELAAAKQTVPEEQLREQRQALNEAINNHDLKAVEAFLHPDFVAKGAGGHSLGDGLGAQPARQPQRRRSDGNG